MPKSFTAVEMTVKAEFRGQAAGKTNREIGEVFALSKEQVKHLINRQNHSTQNSLAKRQSRTQPSHRSGTL